MCCVREEGDIDVICCTAPPLRCFGGRGRGRAVVTIRQTTTLT